MYGWMRRNALYAVLAGSALTSALIAQEMVLPPQGGVVEAQGKAPLPAVPPLPTVPARPGTPQPPPTVPPLPPVAPQPFLIETKQPPVIQPGASAPALPMKEPRIGTPTPVSTPKIDDRTTDVKLVAAPISQVKPIVAPDAPLQLQTPPPAELKPTVPAAPIQQPKVSAPIETPAPAPKLTGKIVPTIPTASSVLGQPEKIQAPAAAPKAEEPKSAWLTHPIVHYLPKSGNFFMLPTGPGYYSAKDLVTHEVRDKTEKYAFPPFLFYTPGFFDADFRYVDQPGSNPDFFERLHRIHLGDNWLFGTGGQAWYRYMNETDSRLGGKTNNYDQIRARAYGDLWYKDRFRIYGEFITAQTFNEDLAPLRIDVNRADLLNLFVEVKIGEWDCNPIMVRAGRQELNIGSQRLLSSLDWGNTRRTFEGVRGYMVSEKLDIDVFYVKPVIIDPTKFDYTDRNQNFAGAWITYKPEKGQALDLYYMYLDNHNYTTVQGIQTFPVNLHTIGARFMGDKCNVLWDFEGAFQFGNANKDALARSGMATAGVGYHAKDLPFNPVIWAYYDWASGDGTPNAGNFNTFNPLFPFGHYYLGFADIVGRQNIRDANAHLYFYPLKWITCNVQYHNFQLDRAADALYNVALTPSRRSANASAGGVVGQEVDFLVNFHLGKHSDIVLGYSKLWSGSFIENTGNGQSPELFYAMYSFRW